jgi:putative flippase GtrA
MATDTRSLRHWGGFVLSGGTAFVVDAAITTGLIHLAGIGPFIARLVGILIAMAVAWLMHRRITFAVSRPPTLNEFLRFATVAWSANLLNYGVYVAVLLLWPATWPFVALLISTGIATIFSYLGFRLGVFREPSPPV